MADPIEAFWQIEGLRLTAFPNEPVSLDEVTWWKQLLGSEPESSNVDRRTGLLNETGSFPAESGLHAQLALSVHALRVQWNAAPPEELPLGRVNTLGPWKVALPPFLELMKAWLRSAPGLKRLALGIVLTAPVSSREEGYGALERFLPFKPDPESSDLLFQTNKRIGSHSLEGVQLNRLSKWSVGQRQLILFALTGGTSGSVQPSDSVSACRLELDLNTAAEAGPLPGDKLEELLEELADLGKRVANDGVKAW